MPFAWACEANNLPSTYLISASVARRKYNSARTWRACLTEPVPVPTVLHSHAVAANLPLVLPGKVAVLQMFHKFLRHDIVKDIPGHRLEDTSREGGGMCVNR